MFAVTRRKWGLYRGPLENRIARYWGKTAIFTVLFEPVTAHHHHHYHHPRYKMRRSHQHRRYELRRSHHRRRNERRTTAVATNGGAATYSVRLNYVAAVRR
jgi:hypothetical protein